MYLVQFSSVQLIMITDCIVHATTETIDLLILEFVISINFGEDVEDTNFK